MKFGKLTGYKIQGQDVILNFEGQEAEIRVITSKIIQVFCALESADEVSKAVEGDKKVAAVVSVQKKEDGLWISTEDAQVKVSDGFYVDFYDRDGREICADYKEERKELEGIKPEHLQKLAESSGLPVPDLRVYHAFEVVKKMQGGEHFYGLGDKTGFLDKRHYQYEMWNTDNGNPHVDSFKELYKSIPFFMTLTDAGVYGIFQDNTYKSFFNMGYESEDYYYFGAVGGNLNYYYIAGENLPEVLKGYMYLTGTCPLPQKWTLGYHQSRFGYRSREDFEDLAKKFREYDIPCDCLHFDIDYMNGFRVFTWDDEMFGGDAAACVKDLEAQGFKAVAIIDPGVKRDPGYYVYQEGVEKDHFVKTPEGEVYINAVWPGEAVFPDFGNPKVREWWQEKQTFLLDKGVRGIWNDMNEPAGFLGPFPDDLVFTDEDKASTHAKMHNVYGHLMAKACYEGLKEKDGRRPFVITRACFAGSQKYACSWTGDNWSIWSHLQMAIPQLCNLGLSGMPFMATDIGGFGGNTTPELLCRWIQLGCFTPFCRNHCALDGRYQEPWMFGEEVLQIYRKYVKLRYQWLPYIYDLFFEEEKTGAPIMRPLVYHYEKDETARVCNDEFMLGEQVLIAPVVNQGMTRRMVYLPEGTWYDYWTHEKHVGPVWFMKEAPLDVCPVYVKAGSIIPTMEEAVSYVGEKPVTTLTLDVYPGQGCYDHYLDNGEDFAYREGAYHQYRFRADEAGNVSGQVIHEGYEKPYEKIVVRVFGQEKELQL